MLRPFNPLSPPSAAPRTQRAWARWCLWWLCVAQICLPLLGKLHDLAHVPMATPVAQLVADVQKADAALNSDDPLSQRWQDLFGKHSAAECQWFGHLALGMGLQGACAPLPIAVPSYALAADLYALLLRASPALFFARGPPL